MEKKKERKKITLKDFGVEKILLIAIAGVILLVTNVSEWRARAAPEENQETQNTVAVSENEAYIESLENKLVHILENVDGVGQVEVMITLEASRESVLNKDDTEELETETETSDGTKNERQSSRRENETVLSDETGESAPYVIKELEPEIAGVVIACQGADNNTVAAAVTEAAQVLFGISVNRIKVLKMEVHQ